MGGERSSWGGTVGQELGGLRASSALVCPIFRILYQVLQNTFFGETAAIASLHDLPPTLHRHQ